MSERTAAMRPGVRIGVDVGTVRVGVAACDPGGMLATPVETLRRGDADLARIAGLARDRGAIEIVVGLPLSLRGTSGRAAQAAVLYARELVVTAALPVRLVDERLSTVGAHGELQRSGLGGRARRSVVDQAAAVIILQSALDTERATGRPPGRLVEELGGVP